MKIPVLPINSIAVTDAVILPATGQAEEAKGFMNKETIHPLVGSQKQGFKKLSVSEISFLKSLIGSTLRAV